MYACHCLLSAIQHTLHRLHLYSLTLATSALPDLSPFSWGGSYYVALSVIEFATIWLRPLELEVWTATSGS